MSAAGGYFGCTRLIRSPWDTPWEILSVASEGLETLDDVDIRPLKLLSFADATASELGSGGADSSAWACALAPELFDFTSMGAESGFFVSGSGFDAIRITGGLPTPADGFSIGAAVAVLGAKVWVVELAWPGVLVEGAATGEDMGASAGAGRPESWGVLVGCGAGAVLDLPSFS